MPSQPWWSYQGNHFFTSKVDMLNSAGHFKAKSLLSDYHICSTHWIAKVYRIKCKKDTSSLIQLRQSVHHKYPKGICPNSKIVYPYLNTTPNYKVNTGSGPTCKQSLLVFQSLPFPLKHWQKIRLVVSWFSQSSSEFCTGQRDRANDL